MSIGILVLHTWPGPCISRKKRSEYKDGFPRNAVVKIHLPRQESQKLQAGLIPESRRSPGIGTGNPPQYSCLENPMGSGTWQTIVCGVAKSWTYWVHRHEYEDYAKGWIYRIWCYSTLLSVRMYQESHISSLETERDHCNAFYWYWKFGNRHQFLEKWSRT